MNVKYFPNKSGKGSVKGTASVDLGNGYAVDVTVIEGSKGLFVQMPQKSYTDKDGKTQYKDLFRPITKEARDALVDAVLAAVAEAE